MRTRMDLARLLALALAAALVGGLVCGCGGGGGGPSGTVIGRIVDKDTGLGVSNTVVTVGSRSDTSDGNGQFSVGGVSLGLQPLFVSPPAPWVAPDPDPSDPQIGDVNVTGGTTSVGDVLVLIEQPPNPP